MTTLCLIMISEELSCSKLASVEFKLHRKQCVNPLCFCKNEEDAGVETYFRQILEDAIRRFGKDDDPLLN